MSVQAGRHHDQLGEGAAQVLLILAKGSAERKPTRSQLAGPSRDRTEKGRETRTRARVALVVVGRAPPAHVRAQKAAPRLGRIEPAARSLPPAAASWRSWAQTAHPRRRSQAMSTVTRTAGPAAAARTDPRPLPERRSSSARTAGEAGRALSETPRNCCDRCSCGPLLSADRSSEEALWLGRQARGLH